MYKNPEIEIADLRERVRILEAVVNNFPGGISVFDADLRMVLCNDQQKRMLDYPSTLFDNGYPTLEEIYRFNAGRGEYGPGDVEAIVAARMHLARQQRSHVFERVRPNGTVLEVRGVPLSGGGFVTSYLDVTTQRRAQARIAHLAHHDVLTDLPNRALLGERLKHVLARVGSGCAAAIHYLDLDGFKQVNDCHGHAIGDELKAVARRLRANVREVDTVARIGGDEFVILQSFIAQPEDAIALARRVTSALTKPFSIKDKDVCIGTSVGIALISQNSRDADELLRAADAALYDCKAKARGSWVVYQEERPSGQHAA